MSAVLPAQAAQAPVDASPRAEAERAGRLFTLALCLVTRGDEVDAVVSAVLGQAGGTGDRAALIGAYGRGVAFRAKYPEDGAARQTVEVLARALSRHHRHRALTPPA
jgi:hypothetical protein